MLHLPNTAAADRVLSFVRELLDEDTDVFVERYVNCREQGYALSRGPLDTYRKVAFSEHRNSDQIVVYSGSRDSFTFNTNIPTDETYDKARYFPYGHELDAAKHILQWLGEN